MTNPITYIFQQEKRFIEELVAFLSIPSISALPEHQTDIRQAAHFLKDKLLSIGVDQAYLMETIGNPLVYAEKIVDLNLPTVLVYGHYDVQPADPYELWHSAPFEPMIQGDKIFARGASDDKGQIYLHVKALETLLALQGLPCNVKFLIEGEEETGSRGLATFLDNPANLNLLRADALLVSDTTMLSMEQPSLTVGMRGIIYVEVTLIGANRDLHSGAYGGAVANPINVLCSMLAALHDDDNKITIPGFYDRVRPVTLQERTELNQVPFDLVKYQQEVGVAAVSGEKGYTTLERLGVRPSLDINGIWGGYTGMGAKTVLPSQAHAKLSMRLVPDQNASKVISAFIHYFSSLAPKSTELTINVYPGSADPIVLNQNSPAFQAACIAFETVWGTTPIATREGGSIPILTKFQEKLGCDIVLMGFGLDSDAIHSPNEHFSLVAFKKGIATVISFYENFAKNLSKQK